MKKPLSIIAATAILAGCSQSTAVKFTLTGRDPAFTDGKYMYIITYAGGPETIIDSARIDNSSFAMKGSWPYPVSAFLYMGRGADGEQISDSDFILETGEIRVEKRNEDEFILTGTPQNEFRNELPQKVAGLRQKGLSPLRTAEACDSLFRAVVLENRNALALSLLENELLTNRPGRELLPLLDSFPAAFQKHPALLGLRKTIAGMRADVGTSYADITGQTPEGDTVSLAATVRKPGNRYVLLSTELLLEGVHFDLTYYPLQHLGYKAVVAGISDILAMNGTPRQIELALGIPARFSVEMVDRLYDGVRAACDRYRTDLAGGDTTASVNGLAIGVTAAGDVAKDRIAYRSGAKPNDLICLSGDLGAAYMGLHLLEREKRACGGQPDPKPKFEGHEYQMLVESAVADYHRSHQCRVQFVRRVLQMYCQPEIVLPCRKLIRRIPRAYKKHQLRALFSVQGCDRLISCPVACKQAVSVHVQNHFYRRIFLLVRGYIRIRTRIRMIVIEVMYLC